MAKTALKPVAPAESPELLPAVADRIVAGQDAAAAAEQSALTLAGQLGYGGPVTVGTLEDEIRFYQRRTVEDLLECGKRLLLLKELTPHGEFTQRVELLGFHEKTARRFMQAAAKTAKSDKLSVLAGQVKNASAFLELVTHDDDGDIERVAELDNIDRMSASELRAALREAKSEAEAKDQLLADKNKALDKAKAAARRLASAPLEEQIAQELQELTARAHTALAYVRGDLRLGFEKLFEREQSGDVPMGSHRRVMAGYVKELRHELEVLEGEFFLLELPAEAEATPE